ncbi:hypothetical protein OG800_19295 [Streptomyces sp. NBC_00445]|uniref:hypothetical protein n=1 Tax=Streptomyces sp. NBC_00445 TaxID=2975745 RepID=UPI002E1ED2B1
MRPNLRRLATFGTCLFAAVALGASHPVSATDGDEDFTLYAREVPAQEDGEGGPPSLGDAFSFADDLYRTKGGEKVGRDGVTCTVVRLGNPADLQCIGTFAVPGGHLTGQALMQFDPTQESEELPTFDIAITGGTGDYDEARGSIHATDDGDYQKLEFRVRD